MGNLPPYHHMLQQCYRCCYQIFATGDHILTFDPLNNGRSQELTYGKFSHFGEGNEKSQERCHILNKYEDLFQIKKYYCYLLDTTATQVWFIGMKSKVSL